MVVAFQVHNAIRFGAFLPFIQDPFRSKIRCKTAFNCIIQQYKTIDKASKKRSIRLNLNQQLTVAPRRNAPASPLFNRIMIRAVKHSAFFSFLQ